MDAPLSHALAPTLEPGSGGNPLPPRCGVPAGTAQVSRPGGDPPNQPGGDPGSPPRLPEAPADPRPASPGLGASRPEGSTGGSQRPPARPAFARASRRRLLLQTQRRRPQVGVSGARTPRPERALRGAPEQAARGTRSQVSDLPGAPAEAGCALTCARGDALSGSPTSTELLPISDSSSPGPDHTRALDVVRGC